MKEKFVKYGFVLGFPIKYIADAMLGKEEEREWILNKFSIVNKREKLKEELLKEFENLKVTEIELEDPVSSELTLLTQDMIKMWDIFDGSLRTWQDKTFRGVNYYLKMSHIENIIYVMRDKNYPVGATIFITPDYTIDYVEGDITDVRYWKEAK